MIGILGGGEDSLIGILHRVAANMFDKYGIKYDLEPEILKEFETISMFNDTY